MARTLIATEMGAKRAKEALIDLGITQTVLAEKRLKYSRSTVSNFFNRKPIAHENFTEICKILKLEWRNIADIAEEEISEEFEQENIDAEWEKPEPQYIEYEVARTEKQLRLAFAIAGTVNQVDQGKLTAIVKLLRQITGDASIEIVDIQEGSIRLMLTGTPEALIKIQTLYRLGKLTKIKRILILNVDFGSLSGYDFRRIDLSRILLSGTSRSNVGLKRIRNIVLDPIQEILRLSIVINLIIFLSMLTGLLPFHWLVIISLVFFLVSELLRRLDLRESNINGADLSKVDLSTAILWGANLSKTDLSGANLWGADLSGTILREANLSEADLSGANLWRADLRKSNLTFTNLRRVDLSEADLSGADLNGANLTRANFRGTNLSNTNFRGANLRSSDLRETDFTGAIVELAKFGSNQGISQNMKQNLISRGAIFDSYKYMCKYRVVNQNPR